MLCRLKSSLPRLISPFIRQVNVARVYPLGIGDLDTHIINITILKVQTHLVLHFLVKLQTYLLPFFLEKLQGARLLNSCILTSMHQLFTIVLISHLFRVCVNYFFIFLTVLGRKLLFVVG